MKLKAIIILFLAVDFLIVMYLLASRGTVALMQPAGPVALQQHNLLMLFIMISLLIVVPLFITIFYIAYRYRDTGKKQEEATTMHKPKLELLWWAIPTVIIIGLSIINWNETHKLDPYRPLESSVKPLRIQVVALDWKWLFLYPDYGIATVNLVQFPEDTPLNFELTADGPMNAFWIPRLGSMIYAMTGMSTKLHLQADEIGDYEGSAAEINGHGFAHMRFTARASSAQDFEAWVQEVKQSPNSLTRQEYDSLMRPSERVPVIFYSSTEPDLYNTIMNKFMPHESMQHTTGGDH